MRNKILFSAVLLSLFLGGYAGEYYMTIEKIDGTLISFKLSDNPVITHEEGNLLVNKDAKTTYSLEDIKNYHFTESDNTTHTPEYAAKVLRIVRIDDETIEVQNADAGSVVSLTTINGVVSFKIMADAEGKAIVKMPRTAGVYVLSAGNQSFKFIRKY